MTIDARMSLSIENERGQESCIARIIDPTETDVMFVLNRYQRHKFELLIHIVPSMPYNRKPWLDFKPMNGPYSFLELLANRGYYRLQARGQNDHRRSRVLYDPNFKPVPEGDDPDDYALGGQGVSPNVTDLDLAIRACVEFLRTGDLSDDLTTISRAHVDKC